MVWFYLSNSLASSLSLKNFQSHYGLILSLWCCNRVRVECAFNPTMVWFYLPCNCVRVVIAYYLSIPLWSDFITFLIFSRVLSMNFFQSHYGLILSLYCWRPLEQPLRSFNPTMVWFYLLFMYSIISISLNLSIPLWYDFISQNKTWKQ